MVARGQNIGTAYVRIIADGAGFKESVEDQLEDVDWEKSARKGSQRFQDAFAEETGSAPNARRLQDALAEPFARGKWLSDEFFNGAAWRDFRQKSEEEFGAAGRVAGDNLARDLARGMDVGNLVGRLDRFTVELARAQDQIGRDHAEALRENQRRELASLTEALAMNKAFDAERLRERLDADRQFERRAAQLHDEAMKVRLDRDRQFEQRVTQLHSEAVQERMDLDREFELRHAEGARRAAGLAAQRRADLIKLREQFALLNREAGQLFSGDRDARGKKELVDLTKSLRIEMMRLNVENSLWTEVLDDTSARLRRVNPILDNTTNKVDRFADAIGTGFGRGSRNDFVNLIGSMARGSIRLVGILPRMAAGMLNYGRSVADAGGALRGFAKVLGDFGKLGVSAAAGLGAIFGILGPLVSLLSLAAGTIVALGSTVVMGAIGGLGALAGAFAPVAAGIGVMVAAFQNLTPEARRAGRVVRESFSGLGDAAAAGVFRNVTEQARRFTGVVGDLRPVVRDIGEAISRVGDSWLDMMETPAFDQFRSAMEDFLPGAVERLGVALGNTFGGLGGTLRGLIPTTDRFLNWLVDITDRWSDWANDTSGQSAIRAFFEDAANSAAELGDFLGSAWNLLDTILRAGNNAGDSLFSSLTRTFQSWDRTLRTNPDMLRNFFEDAERFGRAIGDLVVGLGRVMDLLDNSGSRAIINTVFETLADTLTTIATIVGPVVRAFDNLNRATDGLAGNVALAALALPKITTAMSGVQTSTTGYVSSLRNAETRTRAFGQAARGVAGVGGLVALQGAAGTTNTALSGLMNVGGAALLGFSVGGPIGAAIGGAAGGLYTLLQRTNDTSDAMSEAERPAADYAATLDSLTGSATQATRELVLLEAQKTGNISRARQLGVSTRDLVSAIMGEEGAMDRVRGAIRENDTFTIKYRNSLGQLQETTVNGTRARDRMIRTMQREGTEIDSVTRDVNAHKAARRGLNAFIGDEVNNWRQASRAKRRDILATQDLSEALRKVPKKTATKIDAEGIVPTLRGVAKVTKQYDLVPRQVKPILEALGIDATVKDVRRVVGELDKTDRKRPRPKIDVDTGPADRGLHGLDADIDRFVRGNYTANLRADWSPAQSAIADLRVALANIPDEVVEIHTVRRGPGGQGRGYDGAAMGGLFNSETIRRIGEAGPEAVVPLNRPLAQVDPAVRWLSAIAQGIKPPGMASGGVAGGKTVNVEQHIYAPSADPRAVAAESVNRLVAVGY